MTAPSWLHDSADISLGIAGVLRDLAREVNRRSVTVVAPVASFVARDLARVGPTRTLLRQLQARGERLRRDTRVQVSHELDRLVPLVLAAVLQRTDLTAVVHEQVDIDQLIKDVDLDAVAGRLDVDAVAGRLDVDAVAGRLDVDAVIERLDLTRIVLDRVDMDQVVTDVLDHVDLVGIAEYLIDAVDLPQIVRDSSGALASDTIRGARLRGVAGDRAVQRLRDRVLHHPDRSQPPDRPESPDDVGTTPPELP